MTLALLTSGCITLLLGGALIFTSDGSGNKLAARRLNAVFGSAHQKEDKNKQAFADTETTNRRQLLWLTIRDRASGVGGIRALLPVCLLAILCGGISHFFTTQYGQLVACGAGITVTGGVLLCGYNYKLHLMRKQFDQNLPLAIDLVVRAVSAGVALPASFEHVAESITGAVGKEFQVMHDSIKIGMPIRSALEQAVRRIPSAEFNYFAIILGLNIETGGKLSESLGNLSDKLRSRRHMERKVQALTAEPRMSAIIVSFFPPVFLGLLYMLNKKQFFFLFTDSTGKTLLGYAMASVLIGLLQIYRMTRISA
ncbi:type II secretion system F family protein [Halodesulfovibrio sp.]|jgi:Flp pilus assembly protein TadB|uniref:type II secretion system F family protein n=1 Tax=Halodesulfovibrio sp. TaxID=1912772 RepID=UPI0025F50DB3|nr:type II secretion system F family protein [Halodesulfovibrio sp.]MCT4535246.1 type II secretion system F family protein [Halodesulfovibrio sp.]